MYGPSPCISMQLGNVLRGALFDGALDALEAVHRGVRRQPTEQRFVHHRRTAGRVEHEHRDFRIGFRTRTQRADEPVDLAGLQIIANLVGQRLDVLRRQHILGGDRPFGALGEPLRHLGGGVAVQLGQRVENAARGLAGDDRPGGEGDPLGGIARRHIGVERLGDRLLVERLGRAGKIRLGAVAPRGPDGSVGGGGIGTSEAGGGAGWRRSAGASAAGRGASCSNSACSLAISSAV